MDKVSTSRFNKAPTISKARSRFDLSHPIRTTCNTGDFVVTNFEMVYPGETFSMKNSSFIRLETSLHQTMDNAFLETAHFFVPLRLIWDDVDKFFGYNDNPWARATEVQIPQIKLAGSIAPQSILNHLGVPAGTYNPNTAKISISALPLRAVFEVWNQYYRDQNYDTIIAYSKDSNDVLSNAGFSFNNGYLSASAYDVNEENYKMLRVNRFHDVFSSVLPAPQKGSAATISLGGQAPLVFDDNTSAKLLIEYDGVFDSDYDDQELTATAGADGDVSDLTLNMSEGPATAVGFKGSYADLSEATAVTVNQLRIAIASQAIKERDARVGTRMAEMLYGVWSVDAPSLEIDRPEFLGGKRIPITMMEVLQTSETGTTVLGSDAGHSKTYGEEDGFTKSFVEYGIIVSFAYIRTARSYSQGISRKLFAKDRFDLYDPMLDNIGEVDVKRKEIICLGLGQAALDAPIGYQEPWYWLKEGTAHDSGYFQAGISGTLDSWHYGDSYESGSEVTVNADWLKETPNQVDRTIAVESETSFQWSLNIGFEIYATRMMSRFNIPNTFGFGSK